MLPRPPQAGRHRQAQPQDTRHRQAHHQAQTEMTPPPCHQHHSTGHLRVQEGGEQVVPVIRPLLVPGDVWRVLYGHPTDQPRGVAGSLSALSGKEPEGQAADYPGLVRCDCSATQGLHRSRDPARLLRLSWRASQHERSSEHSISRAHQQLFLRLSQAKIRSKHPPKRGVYFYIK